MKLLFIVLLLTLLTLCTSLFGRKKHKESEDASDLVQSGIDALREAARDPSILQNAVDAMGDPNTMKEVKKMMNDPAFVKEMEKLRNDPYVRKALEATVGIDRGDQINFLNSAKKLKQSDAHLGLEELMKAAKNPKLLAEAMEMLKYPSIVAEVGL